MRKIAVIGIGAGDPRHVTMEAVEALNRAGVFFILDKGPDKQQLADVRQEILGRYVRDHGYRLVHLQDPERDRTADGYAEAVEDWRRRRADAYGQLITAEVGDDETGAFLVWGDPSLFDSTLPILADLAARGLSFDLEVIPGISSVSALAARHRIGLNRIGSPVQVTTGRRLAEQWPPGADDVVVMLDSQGAYQQFSHQDIEIFWGAYLGTPDEILISGPLPQVAARITETRAEHRRRKGWIMDTYLLRRRSPGR
ncbi:MAG TPA: precorrin-6A synthase (deacetylating) [Streptosporangiaceae bacterium]|jgi:precorrin-6A synthase|nr:precorrin-6A synthase (deacetylating) [Streptosporangiaceae bacterium]